MWIYLAMKVLAWHIYPNGIETWKILTIDTWVIKKEKEKKIKNDVNPTLVYNMVPYQNM